MSAWFTASWSSVAYVAASTAAIYATALLAVRLAGRRTISQLSAFDAVITVALGSTLASTAAGPEPSYAEGTAVLATLLLLQVTIAALRQRFAGARRVLDFAPEVVVRHGETTLPSSPASSQLSIDELLGALREKGVFELGDVPLVVLEPNGALSVARTKAEAEAAESHWSHSGRAG